MNRGRLRSCLAIAFALLTLSGCDKYQMTKCPSYVVCYISLEDISLRTVPSSSNCFIIHHGKDYPQKEYGLHSSGTDKEQYDQLCLKHNDLAYNRYRSILKDMDSESVTYNDLDFTSISVTADRDIDEAHPAGTDLGDIVRFMSWSPCRYIQSGYSKYYHYDRSDVSEAFDTMMPVYFDDKWFDNETDAACYPVDKLVKDLTADDLVLLGHDSPGLIGMLYFEKMPDADRFSIAVSIGTDDGRTLCDTLTIPEPIDKGIDRSRR